MRDCGCKWEGALDGRIIRCKKHAIEYKSERQNTVAALAPFREAFHNAQAKIGKLELENNRLKRELNARGLGWVVKAAERNAG